MTFDQELQNLLDNHPEVVEVKVKYRKDTTFKARPVKDRPVLGLANPNFPSTGVFASPELEKAAEMFKNGELGSPQME